MTYKQSDPVASQEEAQALAERIKANACPYRGIYGVQVARLSGTDQWVVTYHLGSLD